MTSLRVLQVLPDTDATDANLAAVELHAVLTGAGVEVRTLALGPGARGELARSVPVIAPSRRSLAAHTQLRAEQRWADVALLRGADVAAVSALAGGRIARVMVLWDEPQRWADGGRVPLGARRAASRCASIVVGWPAAIPAVLDRLEGTVDRVVVLPPPVGIGDEVTSAAARRAARAAVGVPDEQLVVVLSGAAGVGPSLATELRTTLTGAACIVDPVSAPARDQSHDQSLDPEVVRAAADVIVALDGRGGPSPEVVRTMVAGAVLVGPAHASMADLLGDGTTGRSLSVPVTAASIAAAVGTLTDADERHRLAEAGRRVALAEHGAGTALPRWLDLLHAALPSRP